MVALPIFRRYTGHTGRVGYRRDWCGRIVLQVEIGLESYRGWPGPPGSHEWHEDITSRSSEWRDATWEDLVALHLSLRPTTKVST